MFGRSLLGYADHRIRDRRGFQVAIVATAKKTMVLAWHLITGEQDEVNLRAIPG